MRINCELLHVSRGLIIHNFLVFLVIHSSENYVYFKHVCIHPSNNCKDTRSRSQVGSESTCRSKDREIDPGQAALFGISSGSSLFVIVPI